MAKEVASNLIRKTWVEKNSKLPKQPVDTGNGFKVSSSPGFITQDTAEDKLLC